MNGTGVDGGPQLVVFYKPRSGQDRRVDGFIAQVLQRRRNHKTFQIRRVNVEERPDLVERFVIKDTPTLLVVHEGRVRARIVAPKGVTEIATGLAPWLK